MPWMIAPIAMRLAIDEPIIATRRHLTKLKLGVRHCIDGNSRGRDLSLATGQGGRGLRGAGSLLLFWGFFARQLLRWARGFVFLVVRCAHGLAKALDGAAQVATDFL